MSTGEARDAVFKEASLLSGSVGPSAKHYLRVMEKVVNGTEDYITKESKRCVFHLPRLTIGHLFLCLHPSGKAFPDGKQSDNCVTVFSMRRF